MTNPQNTDTLCIFTNPLYLNAIQLTLFSSTTKLFFFVYESKYKCYVVSMVPWCPSRSGLCGIGSSCCLCFVPAVCLHVCKEGICWEDTGRPGPAEETVSVCFPDVSFHLCSINSLLGWRLLTARRPVCDDWTDLHLVAARVKWSACVRTISQVALPCLRATVMDLADYYPEWITMSVDV